MVKTTASNYNNINFFYVIELSLYLNLIILESKTLYSFTHHMCYFNDRIYIYD